MTAPASKILSSTPGLLTPSAAYKPFRYPWAFDMWKKQQQVHWVPEEVPLGEDVKDWAVALNDGERNLLTQIFTSSPRPTSRSRTTTWSATVGCSSRPRSR